MINVSKTYLPEFETYTAILKKAWDKGWITNNGSLLIELEQSLRKKLAVDHLWMTSNGTVVLQMALKALQAAGGEVITTPFSYVATSNAIAWEGCQPVFVDIEPGTYCIDTAKIEAAITRQTRAIIATHVFGMPCDTSTLEAIGKQYGIPVIYDGAHAFGAVYNGKSLLAYGDISTCSFHATKLFHTVEGGCIISGNAALARKLELLRQFGHVGDNYYSIGINGKNSEVHAAMGLAVLPAVDELIAERKALFGLYQQALENQPVRLLEPLSIPGLQWNYAYFPVVFESEAAMQLVKTSLEKESIFPRRYFYPALNTLPFYGAKQNCPIAESIAGRILCLPFYNGLEACNISKIASLVKKSPGA